MLQNEAYAYFICLSAKRQEVLIFFSKNQKPCSGVAGKNGCLNKISFNCPSVLYNTDFVDSQLLTTVIQLWWRYFEKVQLLTV